MSTKVRIRRAPNKTLSYVKNKPIKFGEPIFIKQEENEPGKSYLAIGMTEDIRNGNNEDIQHAALIKGFAFNENGTIQERAVYYEPDENNQLLDDRHVNLISEDGHKVLPDEILTYKYNEQPIFEEGKDVSTDKYFLLAQSSNSNIIDNKHKVVRFDMEDAGIYITSNGVMHGAAWNDYAEKRCVPVSTEPGTVVCENGDGTLSASTIKLQPCPYVVSDTYGVIIGEDDDTPIAISGRALVKCSDSVKVGDCLCAGPDGKASVMTRQEVMAFPDRILGIVTEIPTYKEWNGVKVLDRVWIKIK